MIYEKCSIIFPEDCLYNNVEGFADLATDASKIASSDFSVEKETQGTKCFVSFTGDIEEEDKDKKIEVEVLIKSSSRSVAKVTILGSDLFGGNEIRVPIYTDTPISSTESYTLKVTSGIAKGGLFATCKYEVG